MKLSQLSLGDRRTSLVNFIQASRLRLTLLFVAGLFLIVFGFVAWLWVPAVQTYEVRLSGGIPSLNRHKIAQHFKRREQNLNLKFNILPSEGTADAVTRIEAGELDTAVVNGLIRFGDAKRVRHVATITYEPMHLLVKEEFAAEVAQDYSKLAELSINLGNEGSETMLLANSVIRFLKLSTETPSANDKPRRTLLSLTELISKVDELEDLPGEEAGEFRRLLPDVIMFSSALPSSFAEQLVSKGRFALVPLRFAKAFTQIPVDEEEFDRDHVDQLHAVPSVIPAFTYGGADPAPREDCVTFGSPLILVAHEDVPDEVVTRMLDDLYSGALGRVFHPPSLDDIPLTFPLHPAAIAYRDKDKPLVRSDIAEFIRQLMGALGPIIGGILALYGYYRWRQVLRFLEYFRELQQLDLFAKGLIRIEGVPMEHEARNTYLESQLTLLQRQVVDDFCKNYFYGDGVLENFLSLMAETRDYVRRGEKLAKAETDAGDAARGAPDA